MPTCLGADFLSPVMSIVFHPSGMEVGRRILQKEKLCPAFRPMGEADSSFCVLLPLNCLQPQTSGIFWGSIF